MIRKFYVWSLGMTAKLSLLSRSTISMLLCLSSCTSFTTTVSQSSLSDGSGQVSPVEDGLIYYMPRRAFKVTISVDSTGKIETPTVAMSDTIPDYSHRYVLNYQRNWLGTNHGVLAVSPRGLLESTNTTTTSSTSTIATAIGTLAGTIIGAESPANPPAQGNPPAATLSACTQPNQSYTALIFPEDLDSGPHTLCDYNISGGLTPSSLKASELGMDSARLNSTGPQGGVFYKRDLPYILTLTDKTGNSSAWLAYSPDQAPVSFLSVPGGVFASADANLTIADGEVTQADISSDSEVAGFLQIPANVVSGYFAAIGQIFSARATDVANQNTLESNRTTLAATQAQLQACRAAIDANDLSNKLGAELTAAVANIKSACP